MPTSTVKSKRGAIDNADAFRVLPAGGVLAHAGTVGCAPGDWPIVADVSKPVTVGASDQPHNRLQVSHRHLQKAGPPRIRLHGSCCH